MRSLRIFVAVTLATVLLGHPAGAQQLEGVPDLRNASFLSGSCERLTIAGEDASDVCRGPLYNATYHSGRISFAFIGGVGEESLMVSFSGIEQQREGGRTLLLLDRITLAGTAQAGAATEAAEGICEFGDAGAGPVRIACAGRTPSGDFAGIFTSDGKPPEVH